MWLYRAFTTFIDLQGLSEILEMSPYNAISDSKCQGIVRHTSKRHTSKRHTSEHDTHLNTTHILTRHAK